MSVAAKRGDLVLITERLTSFFVHGSRQSETKYSYVLGTVSSVTRNGVVKAADRIGPATGERFSRWWRKERGSFRHGIHIASASVLTKNPIEIICELGTDEFSSHADAVAALTPYKKAA